MKEDELAGQHLRWSVAQRLEFIEFRLVWEGRINRSDIAERFGVTVHQASADLGLYEEMAPENLVYDRNARRFLPAPAFKPQFLKPLADRQLLQLAAIGEGLVDPAETWFETLPLIGVVALPHRSVPTEIVRSVLEAIRTGSALEIDYQSMKIPDAATRVIAPHSLGYNGARWHARAWCPKNREFRDFVLSRISRTGALEHSNVSPEADREWFENVEMVIVPDPRLNEGARRSLVKEYGMTRGQLRLKVRVALAFYLIQHLNLDLDLPAERKQLVLVNKDEVEAASRAAKEAAAAAING